MANIKISSLGGQDEKGKNLFLISINDDIVIFDAGLKTPHHELYGVSNVIPNLDFLKNNADRIKGIFISNADIHNIGSIPYILSLFPSIKIYCGELTKFIIKNFCEEVKISYSDSNFVTIDSKSSVKVNTSFIMPFQVISSYPEAFGFAIQTDDGSIIYANNYIFDSNANSNFSLNVNDVSELSKNTLVTLCESQNSKRSGFTSPNHKKEKLIESIIVSTDKRVVFAEYDTNIFNISEILKVAYKYNRPISFHGKNIYRIIKKCVELKLISENIPRMLSLKELDSVENPVIIISGSPEKIFDSIQRIALSEDMLFKFNSSDVIGVLTVPQPGNESDAALAVDELSRLDCKVTKISGKDTAPLHASSEDIKMFINITKPKYVLPICGLYKELSECKEVIETIGQNPKSIILFDNGEVIEFDKGVFKPGNKKISSIGDIFVEDAGTKDIGEIVIEDRKKMAKDGIVFIGFCYDNKNKEITSSIDIQMRGVLYIKEQNNAIFDEIIKAIEEMIKSAKKEKPSMNDLKHAIKNKIARLIRKKLDKEPIILPTIIEI